MLYSQVLKGLHSAFNGAPADLSDVIDMMSPLKDKAADLLQQKIATGPQQGEPALRPPLANRWRQVPKVACCASSSGLGLIHRGHEVTTCIGGG